MTVWLRFSWARSDVAGETALLERSRLLSWRPEDEGEVGVKTCGGRCGDGVDRSRIEAARRRSEMAAVRCVLGERGATIGVSGASRRGGVERPLVDAREPEPWSEGGILLCDFGLWASRLLSSCFVGARLEGNETESVRSVPRAIVCVSQPPGKILISSRPHLSICPPGVR